MARSRDSSRLQTPRKPPLGFAMMDRVHIVLARFPAASLRGRSQLLLGAAASNRSVEGALPKSGELGTPNSAAMALIMAW